MQDVISYSAWLEQLPREFWLSAAFGSLVTFLYAINEFARPTSEPVADRPETSFTPAELTSGTDYLISFCLYLTGLLGFYWLVCLIGPAPFINAGIGDGMDAGKLEVPGAFPLYIVMLLVGIMPRLPVLSYFEHSWRRLMHARARIPQAVLVRAADLRRADFDFSRFLPLVQRGEGMYARNVLQADISATPTSASCRWARLSAILHQLTTIETDASASRYIDPGFLDRHRTSLLAITADYMRLAEQIARERNLVVRAPRLGVVGGDSVEAATARTGRRESDPSAMQPVPPERGEQIEALLRRASMLLACAMLSTPEAVRHPVEAMRAFGFLSAPSSDVVCEVDVVIKGVLGSALIYCIFVFIAFRLGGVLSAGLSETGWPDLRDGDDRLHYIFTFMLPQLAAIVGALMLRHAFRRKRAWFDYEMSKPQMPSTRKYAVLGAVSFALALLVSSYFAGTWQGANVILDDLYWRFFEGFVPATSALFICLAIDAAIVDRSARERRWIAVLHPVIACLIALGAADHFYTNDKGYDFTGAVLYSALGTLVYAGALAVILLYLARRDTLVREAEALQGDPLGAT